MIEERFTYEYDINSAYPFIISTLPCLQHGEWSRGAGIPDVRGNELCLVRARVWTRSNLSHQSGPAYIGAMLHRTRDGHILRPTVTEGWYWWHELQAAMRAKCVAPFRSNPSDLHPQCYEWMKYAPCRCDPPMAGVVGLYSKRLEVGKDTPLGKGAKTVYNSDYGKFAQSVGNPVFGNPIYASLITAGCRTMVLDAIATHPKGKADVAMVATDAVYFLSPHPGLKLGKGLGEWECKKRGNLCLFKPGVYWDNDSRRQIANDESPHFKARGISVRDFAPQISNIDAQFHGWNGEIPPIDDDNGPIEGWPSIEYKTAFSMTTCKQAIDRGNWNEAGNVVTDRTLTQNSNPWQKRTRAWFDQANNVYRSEPISPSLAHIRSNAGVWIPRQDVASYPYEKRFGMDDPFSDESKEIMGVSPDGPVYQLIGYAMKGMTENANGPEE